MIEIKPEENPKSHIKVKGCSSCPYAGHFELKECPDAYTPISQFCNLYSKETFNDPNDIEQAIKELEWDEHYETNSNKKIAYNMAINALKQKGRNKE